MRQARSIRRKKIYFLNILVLTTTFFFYGPHPNALFKKFTEWQVEKLLPKGARVDIGTIHGGIFKNIVSEDVRILLRPEAPALEVGKVELDYRLWYPLIGKIPTVPEDGIHELSITNGKGAIDLVIKKENGKFTVTGRFNHINPFIYLSSEKEAFHDVDLIGEYSASIHPNNGSLASAHIIFKNMIINYTPFEKDIEVFTSYERRNGILKITRFKVASDIEGYGHIMLNAPRRVFVRCTINDLMLEEYVPRKKIGNANVSIKGTMNGNFTLEGPLEDVRLLAHLNINEGNFDDFKFDSITASLEGEDSVIRVRECKIRKTDGYFKVSGEVDMRRIDEKDAFSMILLEEDNKASEEASLPFVGLGHELKF